MYTGMFVINTWFSCTLLISSSIAKVHVQEFEMVLHAKLAGDCARGVGE